MSTRRHYRVQAPELAGPERLTPPPVPSDTYAPPPRPVRDDRLAQLADALGVFNSALSAFGTRANALAKKQQAEMDMAIANRTIAGHTNDEYKKLVQTNQIPAVSDPFARAALDKHYGQVIGDSIGNSIRQAIDAGEINLLDPNTDIDKVLTEHSRAALEGPLAPYAGSKAAIAGFRERIDSLRGSLTLAQGKAIADNFQRSRIGMAKAQFDRVFDLTSGAAPEVTQNFVRQVYREIGPKSAAGVPHPEMDKTLLDVLKNRAADENYVKAVLHVLDAERTAQDGQKLPPLSANPRLVDDVNEVRRVARTTLAKLADKRAEGMAVKAMTDAALRQDGSIWSFTDTTYTNPITGEEKTVTADAARKKFTDRFLTESKQQQLDRGESWDVRFEREWAVLARAGIVQPEWKNTLEGAAKAFTDPSSLTDSGARESAIRAANIYLKMAERNPAYVNGVLKLDKTSKDFYSVYDVARTGMGLSDDEALDMAAAAIRPQSEDDLGVARVRARQVQEAIQNTNYREGILARIFGRGEYAENQGAIQRRVMDVAQVLTRVQGMSVDDAIKHAAETVKKRSLFINGTLVPDDGHIPGPEAKPLILKALDNFAKQHPASMKALGLEDSSQLTVRPHGGGHLQIWTNDEGFSRPVYAKDENGQTKPAIISLEMLHKLRQEGADAKKLELQERNRKRRKGELGPPPVGFVAPHKTLRGIIERLTGYDLPDND